MTTLPFQGLRPKLLVPPWASLFLSHSTTILQKDPLVLSSKYMQTLHPDPSHHCRLPTAIINSYLIRLTAPTIGPHCLSSLCVGSCHFSAQNLPVASHMTQSKTKGLKNCLQKVQRDFLKLPLRPYPLPPFALLTCPGPTGLLVIPKMCQSPLHMLLSLPRTLVLQSSHSWPPSAFTSLLQHDLIRKPFPFHPSERATSPLHTAYASYLSLWWLLPPHILYTRSLIWYLLTRMWAPLGQGVCQVWGTK